MRTTRFVTAITLGLGLAGVAAAATKRTLRLPVPGGEQRLTYDPQKVGDSELTFAASLSPRAMPSGLAPHALERCLPHDARYQDCGSRDIEAPAYLSNGEVNVRLNQQELDRLAALKVAPELQPALAWLRRSVSFYAQLEEHRLAFLRSHDPTILALPIEGIEPSKVCAPALAKVRTLDYGKAQSLALRLDWHGCMSEAFSARHGEIPAAPWEAFKKAHDVAETFSTDRDEPAPRSP